MDTVLESATELQFGYWEKHLTCHSYSFLLCAFASLPPLLHCSYISEGMISSPTQAPRVTQCSSVWTSRLSQSITPAALPLTELGSAIHAAHPQDPSDPRSPNRDGLNKPLYLTLQRAHSLSAHVREENISSHTVPKQGHKGRQKCVGLPHTPALCNGAKARTVLSPRTLVVERPEEGVPVCSLEEGVFNLHLPPAQLLAASKPLGQSEYALTLFYLLLDGMESVLRGLWRCSQPRALEDRNSFAEMQHMPPFGQQSIKVHIISSSPGVGATRNHPLQRAAHQEVLLLQVTYLRLSQTSCEIPRCVRIQKGGG